MKIVEIEGIKFRAEECSGVEYKPSQKGKGYPFDPFKYQKYISSEYAYLVDAKGIIWIFNIQECCLIRPSLATCLSYIVKNDRELDKLTSKEIFLKLGIENSCPEWYNHIIEISRKHKDEK